MYDFIDAFLIENNFELNKERTGAVEYFKYTSPIFAEFKLRNRLDVLVADNLITITEILENKKEDSEHYFTICRSYIVNNIDELRYLFLNNIKSYAWFLDSK